MLRNPGNYKSAVVNVASGRNSIKSFPVGRGVRWPRRSRIRGWNCNVMSSFVSHTRWRGKASIHVCLSRKGSTRRKISRKSWIENWTLTFHRRKKSAFRKHFEMNSIYSLLYFYLFVSIVYLVVNSVTWTQPIDRLLFTFYLMSNLIQIRFI